MFQSRSENKKVETTGKKMQGFVQRVTRALSMIVVLSICSSALAGCSSKDIKDLLNVGGAEGMYDAYGRLILQAVSPTLNEYEYQIKEDEEGNLVKVPVTNKDTGSIIFTDSPYAHALDQIDGESITDYNWTSYQIVVDGTSVYFVPNNNLMNEMKLYSGLNYNIVANEDVLNRFSLGFTGSLVYSNHEIVGDPSTAERPANSLVNKYYDLDTDYDFFIYDEKTGTTTPASKDYIKVQYKLAVVDAKTGAEALWNETNEYYYATSGQSFYNTVLYRIVFNPRLENGTETRTLKVKKLVQDIQSVERELLWNI